MRIFFEVNVTDIKFTVTGADPNTGEKLYSLRINGKIVADGLTIDQVVRRIGREDEEELGERHIQLPEHLQPRHSRR